MDPAAHDRMLRSSVTQTARAWRALIDDLRAAHPLEQLEARLYHPIPIDVTAQARSFGVALHHVYLGVAQQEARYVGKELDSNVAIRKKLVTFDPTDPAALDWATANQLRMVREISAETRQLIAAALAEGRRRGLNPRDVAKLFLDSLGLTEYQMARVESYRRALESGDLSRALQAELGDGRYDRMLRAAIDSGDVIPLPRIDVMVARYRQNWIRYRAETIARTEGLRAAHQGSEALFDQAVTRGTITRTQVQRTWLHKHRKGERPGHEQMHNQVRGMGEAFETPGGIELRYPCDPEAPIEETANCTCAVATRIVPATQLANAA